MSQAKTLTARELRKVLDFLASKPHPARNRLIMLMTHWSGIRVGKIAALCIADVRDPDGMVKAEIRLGKHAKTVFANDRLRKEIALVSPYDCLH